MDKIENNKKIKDKKDFVDNTAETKVFKIIRKEDLEKSNENDVIVKKKIINKQQKNVVMKEKQDSSEIEQEEVKENLNAKARKEAILKENVSLVEKKQDITKGKYNSEKFKIEARENSSVDTNINSAKANNKADISSVKTNSKTDINNANISNKINDTDSKNTNSTRKKLVVCLIILVITIIAIVFSTIFAVINKNSDKIINGVLINGIDVSGLNKEEAGMKLESALNNSEINCIVVNRGNYKKEIHLDEINGHFEIEKAVDSAYSVGREENLVKNNYIILGSYIKKNNLSSNLVYDESALENKIKTINIELPGVALDATYVIDGNNLIIKKGSDGLQIQKDEFKNRIIKAFSGNEKTVEIPVEHTDVKEIDIEAIYNEVYKKPVNAYYTKEPRKIYKEEYGLDFAISLEDAKKMLLKNKDEYEIPLKKLNPEITVSDLDDEAFPNKLSTFTTYYGTADVNRNSNIAVAAKSINNVVVMPGETFSYNDLIGECSTKTGYKESTIYLNGELSTGIGGGICQVSTTLYNTVLRANLEIVERRNHSLGVTYVPAGHDAMVSIGTSDFKFKNNRDYPIKVSAYVSTGSVTCEIKGLKQANDYEVKLESKEIERNDTKYKVETYKVLYQNGKVVSRVWLSKDTYKVH